MTYRRLLPLLPSFLTFCDMPIPILEKFHPVVRTWFTDTFGEPSPPQLLGWPSISSDKHTLIVAPTGSGKTLAAFLWCINHLVEEIVDDSSVIASPDIPRKIKRMQKTQIGIPRNNKPNKGVRVLYVSPLKALNNDIHRNLEVPLKGIAQEAEKQGLELPLIRSAVRTGDTTQSERASMIRNPPDILITTPESLYLMLTAEKSRPMFSTVQYVIVDEIHSISSNKRGVHLSVTLERLEELVKQSREQKKKSFVRIGLSATQRPLEEISQYLGGFDFKNESYTPRPVTIIDAGYKKNVDLKVICPASDFTELPFDSVWHLIYPELLHLILEHKTTLIFVNSRRVAERLSGKLNEILEGQADTFNNYAVPVYDPKKFPLKGSASGMRIFAYHGSMSRQVREKLEKDLKSGTLRCLITTSALELGIDIGSVDLVVQIQSPKGIARGLQRIGRSGHLVSAQSKGRIIVTHRDDLVESAVVAHEMIDNKIERTFIPKNCLDVLAQQIVSMVSVEDWQSDELFDLLRQSYNYNTLSEKIFHSVLEMLAGRYMTEAFRELRARIMWDKLHDTLTALPGSSRLAVTNSGTIPDRGYFGVYLEDLKTKVGEVDEEFIYESRTGDTFILGSNVWRMMDIDANKVIVVPAPGQPARMPFWKGESIGRTYELSMKLGEFLEHLSTNGHPEQVLSERSESKGDSSTRSSKKADSLAQSEHIPSIKDFPLDAHSVRNLTAYIAEQRAATQIIPTHKTIVVEGFRDEIGDPRIVVHSIFGKSINGLFGIVLLHTLRQRLDIDIQMLYNDSGILLRCSDVERLPLDILSDLSLHEAERILLEEIPSSPLFGALFRQNAERAMLLPKGLPGKRRPFFLQRLKAADLLQVVKQYADFPIVIETMRECLNDVLDLGHFKEIVQNIEAGGIHVHTVQTEIPSPFASSILFDFAAVYMYERDDPKNAGKQQHALLNRELLSEVVQLEDFRSVVRSDAVVKVEEQLQHTTPTRKARSPEEVMEILLRIGEMTRDELNARTEDSSFVDDLITRSIVISIRIGSTKYCILTEEYPLYASISSCDEHTLQSIPDEYKNASFPQSESLTFVIGRMLRSHGPLTVQDIIQRYGLTKPECEKILHALPSPDSFVHGKLTDDAAAEQWCYRPNLERIHRASIAIRRKEITPASMGQFTQLLLHWQHRHPAALQENEEGMQELLEQLEGYTLSPDVWEPEILKTRMKYYDPSFIRSLVSRGTVLSAGTPSGKSQWILRGDGHFYLPSKELSSTELSKQSLEIYAFLKENGASFLTDIREGTKYSLASLNRSLAELFWNGLVTNDMIDEVVNIKRFRSSDDEFPAERVEIVNPRRNPLKSVAMKRVRTAIKQAPGWNGRWSLVHTRSILGNTVSDEEKIQRQAQQLLLRYGIVAREIAKREENLLPWPLLAMEFQRMEMRGDIRRGYFVEGLSGMQFALPDAVRTLESIKSTKNTGEMPLIINACDPANPYGTGVELNNFPRISRIPSNYFIFDSGLPVAWLENFGTRIFIPPECHEKIFVEGVRLFVDHVRKNYPSKNEIVVEYINAQRPTESPLFPPLQSIGFYRDKAQTIRIDVR